MDSGRTDGTCNSIEAEASTTSNNESCGGRHGQAYKGDGPKASCRSKALSACDAKSDSRGAIKVGSVSGSAKAAYRELESAAASAASTVRLAPVNGTTARADCVNKAASSNARAWEQLGLDV